MKKLSFLLLAVSLFTLGACDDDDDGISATVIEDNLEDGTWRITNYSDSGDNETDHFNNFIFNFDDTGVVTASNGNIIYPGTWSITDNDDDDNSLEDLDFHLTFVVPEDFAELTQEWEITSQSSTRVELRHVSGGGGGTDNLTFQKN